MATPALNPLVEKIRAKYPGAYDDMDDAALTKALLAKYPQYSDLAAPAVQKPQVNMEEQPGVIQRFGEATGIPTSMEGLKSAITPATIGGIPIAPAQSGLGTAVNYGKNLIQQLMALSNKPSIESGMNAITALTPGGQSQQSAAKDIAAGNYPGAAGTALGVGTQFALPELAERAGPTINRLIQASGAGAAGAIKNAPIIGRPLRGAIRGFTKSWQGSAPETEIPPSKVSTTAPEASPAVSLNRLTSDIQSLGYSKADALARAKAGIAKYPNDLNAATTEAMRSNAVQQAKAPTTPPPSRTVQVAQAKAAQGTPAAVESKPQAPPTQYEVAPPSRPLRIEGKEVPANTELTPALQKSIPQNRIQGKIMQVVRREGTLGMDRLMQAPELQGFSREQVEKAATGLGNSKKLWVPTKEADAHGPAGIISLAIRKP